MFLLGIHLIGKIKKTLFDAPERECLFLTYKVQKCEAYRMGKVKNIIYILLSVRFGGSKDSIFPAAHFFN